MAMCTRTLRYHGDGGISRAMFFVRQGASNPEAMFLPSIPPSTVRGNPTSTQTNMNGSACEGVIVSEGEYRGKEIPEYSGGTKQPS